MATVPHVGDVAAPKGTTPVTPAEQADDSKTGAVLDAIQKTSVYVNKSGAVATGLQTSAQATANLDYESGRKVLSGALKIKDKMTEVANKGEKVSVAPTKLRTGLAGAGVVAGTASAIKYGQKTADDIKKGHYGAAVVDGLQSAKGVATTVDSGSKLLKGTAALMHGSEEAVVHTGAEVLAETGGKALGRFVPGANVVIAVADGAVAAKSWVDYSNGKGSIGKAIGNSVTALGSGLAATNIPIVSQIGAGVSVVSSLITGFFVK